MQPEKIKFPVADLGGGGGMPNRNTGAIFCDKFN